MPINELSIPCRLQPELVRAASDQRNLCKEAYKPSPNHMKLRNTYRDRTHTFSAI
jgi:hypothetical protein